MKPLQVRVFLRDQNRDSCNDRTQGQESSATVEANQDSSAQMPPFAMNSPKFITCPDCGERYDKARKRRVIDTCGHPRCYSCLVLDNPCVLCAKLPVAPRRPRANTTSCVAPNTSTPVAKDGDKNESKQEVKLRRDKGFGGSHPDISALKKERSATLPSFRTDSYFRSLYRYEPNGQCDGSQENLSSCEKSNTAVRPKSLPPSYHKSLENLHEQFWRSVQHVQRTNPPRQKDQKPTSNQETASSSSTASPTPEVVECPAPNSVRLPVSQTRPRSSSDLAAILQQEREKLRRELQLETQKKQALSQTRTRSQTDLSAAKDSESWDWRSGQERAENALRPGMSNRPQSWSPSNFRTAAMRPEGNNQARTSTPADTYRPPSGGPRPQMWLPIQGRTTPMSDGSSEISISFSDSSSVSSGESDSLRSPVSRAQVSSKQQADEGSRQSSLSSVSSSPGHSPRRRAISPLASVTYWVTDSGNNSPEIRSGYMETDLDAVIAGQRWQNHACAEVKQTN